MNNFVFEKYWQPVTALRERERERGWINLIVIFHIQPAAAVWLAREGREKSPVINLILEFYWQPFTVVWLKSQRGGRGREGLRKRWTRERV